MKHLVYIIIFVSLVNGLVAQTQETRVKHYNTEDRVALSGYDPMSYFLTKPIKGKAEFAYTYKGITYHFISEKSKQAFKANPDKYEPEYGGWCAYALAKKKPVKMEVNPETYKIKDGKLYLFYDKFGFSKLKNWNKDEENLMNKANNNWKEIISK